MVIDLKSMKKMAGLTKISGKVGSNLESKLTIPIKSLIDERSSSYYRAGYRVGKPLYWLGTANREY